jgi:hypothetical protein
MITSQIFGLVLTVCSSAVNTECSSVEPTSCTLTKAGDVECDEMVIDVAYHESICYAQLEREIPNLLELESLKCEVIKDMEY